LGVVVVASSLVEVGAVPSPGAADSPGIVGVEPATADFAVVAGMVAAVAADKAASAVAGRARTNLYHSYHRIVPPLAAAHRTGDKVPFVVAYVLAHSNTDLLIFH